MAGPAFTLRYIPAREDIDTLDVYKDYDHPQRKAIETVPPGHVLVMDCRGQGRAASAGGILLTRLEVRGAAGLVTDGALRDTPEIAKLGLPVYAQGASPLTNLAQHHATDINVPIGCAEVADLPRRHHGRRRGRRRLRARSTWRRRSPKRPTSRTNSRTGSRARSAEDKPLRGTYPPDEDTLRRYHDHRPSG